MRKLFILIIFSVLICSASFSQKTISDPNVQQREVKSFHAITVTTGIHLILTQGDTEGVAVSANTIEDREKIITTVENGVLKISYDYNLWKIWRNTGDKKLKAYVSIVNIDKIKISAGAYVAMDGILKSPDLDMEVSSGGTFNGKIEAGEVDLDQNSGSRVNISGTAKNMICSGNSGSRLSGYDLAVDNCDIKTSSGARVEVTVNGEISARASSGGQISYQGKGVLRTLRTSSGGGINKRG